MAAHGIMFHHFHDDTLHPDGQGAMTADQLSDMIEFLGRDNILSATEWQDFSRQGKLKDNHRCLTFDDALRCQYDIANPVWEHYGLTGFWFVYSSVFEGNIERLEIYRHFRNTEFQTIEDFYQAFFKTVETSEFADLVKQQMKGFDPDQYLAHYHFYTREDRLFRYMRDHILGVDRYNQVMDLMITNSAMDLSALPKLLWMNDNNLRHLHTTGHIIGLHSYSHPTTIGQLPKETQLQEYLLNRQHLEKLLGDSPIAMSHPCCSYNEDTLDILEYLGVETGFRANMLDVNNGRYEHKREDHAHVLSAMKQGKDS